MTGRIPISPDERKPLLDARREGKMTSSAHAYVRGSTKRFYEWLVSSRGQELPKAPSIWIGGDCHVGNLGALATKDGGIEFELRDLDQTVIGSPAHDVVRLALSMAMAVRASALPGMVTARVVEAIARGYEVVLEARAADREFVLEKAPLVLVSLLRDAGRRSRKELFTERLGGSRARIPIGKRFWPLTTDERAAVEKLVATAKVRKLLTGLTSREDDSHVTLLDAAYWVKGCSSLGFWRAAAIVNVRAPKSKSSTTALIDIKEARPAVAPRARGSKVFAHHGERVVEGARALSPSLGDRMAAATVLDKSVFVRELLPPDTKFELETLMAEEAVGVARYLASVVATAHARQLKAEECAEWLGSFRKENASNLEAPAWLWSAVVDLVALHEGAYLQHCQEHLAHAST